MLLKLFIDTTPAPEERTDVPCFGSLIPFFFPTIDLPLLLSDLTDKANSS